MLLDIVAVVGLIAIIIVFFSQVALVIALTFLVLKLRALVGDLQAKVDPLLTSAQQTARSVQGTTDFVATATVRPMIRVLAIASALQRFFEVLIGGRRS